MDFVKHSFPLSFSYKRVLDVGSGDINGNNRYLFTNCEYHGNDVVAGKNVTVVSKTSALPFATESMDTIVSTECFEHDPEYRESLLKIVDMLKPGSLFAFTCASEGRPEHGTRRTRPEDSLAGGANVHGFAEYYKNLGAADVAFLKAFFPVHHVYYNEKSKDLYFMGFKHDARILPEYKAQHVVRQV